MSNCIDEKTKGIKCVKAIIEQYRTNFVSLMPNNLYGPNNLI